jgi:hypothetical protein
MQERQSRLRKGAAARGVPGTVGARADGAPCREGSRREAERLGAQGLVMHRMIAMKGGSDRSQRESEALKEFAPTRRPDGREEYNSSLWEFGGLIEVRLWPRTGCRMRRELGCYYFFFFAAFFAVFFAFLAMAMFSLLGWSLGRSPLANPRPVSVERVVHNRLRLNESFHTPSCHESAAPRLRRSLIPSPSPSSGIGATAIAE